MMKLKYNIPLLSALLLLAGCSNDDGTTGSGTNSETPIVLQASVANGSQMRGTTDTHIASDVLAADLNVDLFLDEDMATGTTATYTGQKFYLKSVAPATAGDPGGFKFYTDEARTTEVIRYWPPSGNGLYFYAYYPAGKISETVSHTTTATQTFTVETAQGAADGAVSSDLLFGTPNANPYGTAATNPIARPTATTMAATAVNLNFQHCLSKVEVQILGDGYGIGNGTQGGPETGENAHKNGFDQYGRDQFTNATITLGAVNLQADVTTNTGAATAKTGGANGTVTLKNSGVTNDAHTYHCVLPPGQSLTGKTITLTLTDGGTKTYTIPTTATMEAGKVYTYQITIGLYEIHVTATVGDWTSGTIAPGNIKF